MKPYSALEAATVSDFSHCALEEAFDIIQEHLLKNALERDGYKSRLIVSSEAEDLIPVIDLARVYNLSLSFSPKYVADEWSISAGVKGSAKRVIFWSGGA